MNIFIYSLKGTMFNLRLIEKNDLGIDQAVNFKSWADFSIDTNQNYSVPDLVYPKLFNEKDLGVNILSYSKVKDDFVIVKLSNYDAINNINDLNFIGQLTGDTFPLLKMVGLLDLIKKSFNNDKVVDFEVRISKNEVLKYSFHFKTYCEGNFFFLISKNIKTHNIRTQKHNKVFKNYSQGIFFIQNKKIILKNQAFLRMEQDNNYLKPFTFKDIQFKDISNGEWLRIYNELINRDRLFFEDIIVYNNPITQDKAFFNAYFSPFTRNDVPGVKVNCVNVTREILARIKYNEFLENLRIVQGIGKFAIMFRTREEFINYSSEIYNILEIPDPSIIPEGADVLDDYVPLNIKNAFYSFVNNSNSKNDSLSFTYPVTTFKGNKKYLTSNLFYVSSDVGNPNLDYIISVIQDITSSVNNRGEIIEANNDLQKLLQDKEVLINEVQTRINSNLNIIINSLDLDLKYYKNNPDLVIQNSINRINSIALIHEYIYKSDNLNSLNIHDFIKSEVNYILNRHYLQYIDRVLDVENIEINMNNIVPLGLIINELIHNSIKHAFDEEFDKALIKIKFYKKNDEYNLIVSDNGKGLPEGFNILKSENTSGFTIVNSLVSQINGELIQIDNLNGCTLKIVYPVNEYDEGVL